MNRPPFKNSELGPIPADWEVKRLGEIAPLQRGFDLPTSALAHGTVPVVYSNGILNFHKTGLCDAPGLVIGRSGTIGKFTFIGRGTYWPHNTTLWVTSFCGNEPKFVYYLYSRIGFERFSGGTGVPTLNRNDLHAYQVAIPISVDEQRRIAAALSDADTWIESLDKLIEKKKLVKQGAMQALLSGKTRLPGFSGEWEDEVVGDAFVFLRTNTLSRSCLGETGCISDVHYGDVLVRYGNILDFSAETPPFIGEGHESRSIGDFLQDGDLVVADTAEDETVGKAVEIQHLGNRQAVAGLHTVACRPKHPFAPGWLGHFINSPFFHDQLLPLISGTKVSSISKENLKTVFVRRPPLAEQAAIVSVLSDMDVELAALAREKAKAEQIKQGMMQELLTGKTRLLAGE